MGLEKPDGSVAGAASTAFDIHYYAVHNPLDENGIEQLTVLSEHKAEVSAMAFSPTGGFLATADAGNKILLWDPSSGTPTVTVKEWATHTARVTPLAWLPSGKHLVSGSLDQSLNVWSTDEPGKRMPIKEGHRGGVTAVAATGDGAFATVGHD